MGREKKKKGREESASITCSMPDVMFARRQEVHPLSKKKPRYLILKCPPIHPHPRSQPRLITHTKQSPCGDIN
ncbi:hypothetical protein VTJ04DRAFT_1325 [Mycothermus thermophilus]|uniref:uncharacterized protein n=1 Tax=Humicola insolens TaxID=85995 RepID=UPI0037430F4D